jgi:hypothetical protein
MKTIKFKATFESSIAHNCTLTEELTIEVDDDYTEKEIEDAKEYQAQEWAANLYSISYE